MSRVTITPLRGLLVPKPDGQPLAAEGETLEPSQWWSRREAEGAVTIEPASNPRRTARKTTSKED